MTIQELVKFCEEHNIPLTTNIAIRCKDDYLITDDKLYIDKPYFGNCSDGRKWVHDNITLDENGYTDEVKIPEFLILKTED